MKYLYYVIILLVGITVSGFLTWLCIVSGIDWQIAKFFEKKSIFIYAAIPGVFAGMIVPLIFLGYFYLKSKNGTPNINVQIFKKLSLGLIVSFVISSFLKSITNRMDMEPFEAMGNLDYSSSFRWGFLNSNSFWESFSEGWPSGHSFIATTFFVILFPILNKSQRILHFLYVLLIMLSVVTAFHWFSDIISGLILGAIIGKIFQIKYTK